MIVYLHFAASEYKYKLYKYARNSTHECTNAVNNVQPIRNLSHMAKILSVCNRLQARDYENGNGCKRRVSRLTQFIHTTLHFSFSSYFFVYVCVCMCVSVCQSQICIMHDCLKIQVNSTNTHGFQAKTKTGT